MNTKKFARMGPKGTGSSHTMTAVLMALMMVFLGGVTAHLDTVDTVSTNEQLTIDVTDHSSSNGKERRAERQHRANGDKKRQQHDAQRAFDKKREESESGFISQTDGKDDLSALLRLRNKANGFAASLRKSNAKRLSIPTPEVQAEKLARMVKGGAPLKKWVEAVKSEIDFILSVPYQIDYIFHSVLQYGALKEKGTDIKVVDLMHAVASVYPRNLNVNEQKWDQWSQNLLGKDQGAIQKQFVSQTQLSGWKKVQKKHEKRVAKVIQRLQDALNTEIEAKGEVVTYDKEKDKYSLAFDGQPGNEDSEHKEQFNERCLLPEMQLHLMNLQKAQREYLREVSEIKDVAQFVRESHKTSPEMAKKMEDKLKVSAGVAKATRADAINSLLNEVERLYKLDTPTKRNWVKQSRTQMMEEFREKYTPRAWTATCGVITWHFHSGFEVYFAKPIRVKPVTAHKSGKKVTWNVPIDNDGYATVLQALGGFLYTVENPMERVMRSKSGKTEPTMAMRFPQGKEYLQQFESEDKKNDKKKMVHFDHQGTVSHRHVCPSHFTGLLGYMGPSNGAFVTVDGEKNGKFTVRGDEYSYTRLNARKLRKSAVNRIFAIDKALNAKKDPVGMKLRGWWMQSTCKEDVPDPAFGKKRDQKLPEHKPRKKGQKKDDRKRGNPLDDVKDIEVGYDPQKGPAQVPEKNADKETYGFVQSPRGPEHPNQGVKILKDSELPERPKREKKGTTVPASRRTSPSTESATINADLQPFTEPVDYEAKTVAELKELLKASGLKVSGKKAELIERLTANGQ